MGNVVGGYLLPVLAAVLLAALIVACGPRVTPTPAPTAPARPSPRPATLTPPRRWGIAQKESR